ncbi:hypothetical protein A1D31_39545 [Bradyrhizobium liaoningense]|nr:hypothetical protein A1D31_39545 [Bradyrhizobium liaoningense]
MEVIRNVSNSKTFNTDIVVATRIDLEWNAQKGDWPEPYSRLMRTPDGKLYSVEEPNKAGGREVVTALSHKRAQWLG